jgi:mannitol-1-phosphate 5-dehydrogenase
MARCLVIGAGRIAGGFVAPVLRDAGWDATLVSRTPAVVDAITATRGVRLSLATCHGVEHRSIDGLDALLQSDEVALAKAVDECDLLVTAVGPSELRSVATSLAPMLAARVRTGRPLNVIAFENHPNAAHELGGALIATRPDIAPHIGRTLGIAGAAVWRCIARRELGPDGVRYVGDAEAECHIDESGIVDDPFARDRPGGFALSTSFRARMTEKLWLSNAPHAAVAYLGWQRGHATIDAALGDPLVAARAADVVAEVQDAFARWQASRPWADIVAPRDPKALLARHADGRLADLVARVARDPRRKLGAEDRLIAPALVLAGAGEHPDALADVCAAALDYRHPDDQQSLDIGDELRLLGAAETLGAIAGLDPEDWFVQVTTRRYAALRSERRARLAVGVAA